MNRTATLKMPIDFNTIIDNLLKLVGGALGVKILDYYLTKRKEKKELKQKDEFLSNLKEISMMNYYMADVIDNTPAERFLILMGHDSGNIPNPKHPYFARAMWQKLSDGHDNDSLTNKYDSVKVDFEYINTVIELLTKGYVKLEVDKMPDCFLKRIYQGEGVKYSELYFLGQEKSNKIYYCSIATSVENETFDDVKVRAKIDLSINHIQQIFSNI